jgi:DNA helicase-2/ATP-dependent DNA helicase PcrA
MIVAGPGSGKTRVITTRVAALIDSGIEPERIMVTTFTRKAAKELKERVKTLVGNQAEKLYCGTFHSLALSLLREIGYDYGVIDDFEAGKILNRLAIKHKLQIQSKDFQTDLSRIKAWMLTPGQIAKRSKSEFETNLADLYRYYETYQKENHLMDFDNIIWNLIKISKQDNIKSFLENKFDYVSIDEFQDSSYMQSAFLKLFLKKHCNIMVIGDIDQSIYNWRGANLREILDFKENYPGTEVISLPLNYRSTNTIVKASASVIANNTFRLDKKLKADTNINGSPINVVKSSCPEEEYDTVCSIAEGFVGTTAILARVNWQLEHLKSVLDSKEIPYHVVKDSSRAIEPEDLEPSSDTINILTIHAAKGLEFDNVIVTGAEDGIMPHYLNVSSQEEIEEERRLFYVALTRAKKRLVISNSQTRKGRFIQESRFIKEIPKKYVKKY